MHPQTAQKAVYRAKLESTGPRRRRNRISCSTRWLLPANEDSRRSGGRLAAPQSRPLQEAARGRHTLLLRPDRLRRSCKHSVGSGAQLAPRARPAPSLAQAGPTGPCSPRIARLTAPTPGCPRGHGCRAAGRRVTRLRAAAPRRLSRSWRPRHVSLGDRWCGWIERGGRVSDTCLIPRLASWSGRQTSSGRSRRLGRAGDPGGP